MSWLATPGLDVFLFTLTFFFLVAISVGGTARLPGALGHGPGRVRAAVRRPGRGGLRAHHLAHGGRAGAPRGGGRAGALPQRAAAPAEASLRRLYPCCLGALAIVGALLAPSLGILEGTFQGFGLRAILLSVILIVIRWFRPEGLMGRFEFSWAALLRERRDEPTDEERAQDAWLTNPALNKDKTAAFANEDEGENESRAPDPREQDPEV